MGATKQAALDSRNYERNWYRRQKAEIKKRIRLYAGNNPGFVAGLKHELTLLDGAHKEYVRLWKRMFAERRSKAVSKKK